MAFVMVLVTCESVLTLMPHHTLTGVDGKPTHKIIKKLEKELGSNLIAALCPWGHNEGHLGILHDTAIFVHCNSSEFTPPLQAPPIYPDIPPAATTAQCERFHADSKDAQCAWVTFQHVQCIAFNLTAEAIKPVF